MGNAFAIQDSFRNKVSLYHIVLFLAFLPFDRFYSEIIFISFAIHTLIHLNKNDSSRIFRKEIILLQSVFFISLVCSFYTVYKHEAYDLLIRQLSILLFPVLLFFNPIDLKKYAKGILLSFAFVCTVVISYLYFDAIRIIRFYHLPFASLLSSYFMNHNFSEPLDIHATYLSLYVCLSLITLIYYFLFEDEKKIKVLYLVAGSILLAGLIQLGSRAVFVAFLLAFCLVIPFALKGRKRLSFLIVSLLLSASLTLAIAYVHTYKSRYLLELKNDLSEDPLWNTTTGSRMERWQLAFELVKNAPLIGYGTDSEVVLLKEKYFENRLYNAYLNNLNAHNQYISFLITGGILALVVYLLTLAFGLRLAIKSKNIIFAGFIVLLLATSVSENILERNKGIFFYSFFLSFFVCAELKSKEVTGQATTMNITGNLV
ncbi:MAG: O-antigen ligase family protein [Flavisolibacter sp.]|nr:O-antigen ligase family protein [Flavisolibacter sp.]